MQRWRALRAGDRQDPHRSATAVSASPSPNAAIITTYDMLSKAFRRSVDLDQRAFMRVLRKRHLRPFLSQAGLLPYSQPPTTDPKLPVGDVPQYNSLASGTVQNCSLPGVPVPQLQIVVHRAHRRQVFWQSLPGLEGAVPRPRALLKLAPLLLDFANRRLESLGYNDHNRVRPRKRKPRHLDR
jgi:hypothetical protein